MLLVTTTLSHRCVHLPLRSVPIETSNVLSSDGQIDRGTFLGYWKAVNDSLEVYSVINDAPQLDLKVVTGKLAARNIFFIAQRDVAGPTPSQVAYYSFKLAGALLILLEVTFQGGQIKLCVRTEAQPFAQQATALVESVLRA
eukprot:3437-Heterococcus_DN1.PRE.2